MAKRFISIALVLAVLFSAFSVCVFSEDEDYQIYDDQENYEYDEPEIPETTTKKQVTLPSFNIGGNSSGVIDDAVEKIGSGLQKLTEGLRGGLTAPTTAPTTVPTTAPRTAPTVNQNNQANYYSANSGSGSYSSGTPVAEAPATKAPSTAATTAPSTTKSPVTTTEPGTVAALNSTDKDELSGSTLTAIAFVGGIVILILVLALVLVILTRRTEFDSKVGRRTTLPGAEDIRVPHDLTNDDIPDDGKDYSNILPDGIQNKSTDTYDMTDDEYIPMNKSGDDDLDPLYDGLEDILEKYK